MSQELSLAELQAMAALAEDQTEEQSHIEFDNVPPEGVTVGRLIEYVDLGKHPQKPFQGKAKPDADMVRITFELLHPEKNMFSYEKDGQQKTAGQLISIRIKKSLSDKSNFKKLFKKMVYGRDNIKHFAQMIGEAFVITIYHNKVAAVDGKPERLFVNLNNKDGEYGISAPFMVDAISQKKSAYDILPQTQPLRFFWWDKPTKGTWDSLFIDGTREQKDAAGVITQVSKNWIQELILSATNYKGSPLDLMLNGLDDLPKTEADVKTAALPDAASEQTASTAGTASSVDVSTTKTEAALPADTTPPATGGNEALAALGLLG